MKKAQKNYVSPQVRERDFRLEYNLLTVSAIVPGAAIEDAEEEEWTVS